MPKTFFYTFTKKELEGAKTMATLENKFMQYYFDFNDKLSHLECLQIFFAITISFFIAGNFDYAFATSGACSSHGGVDCNAGMQTNGKVRCNDGWLGSMVEYEYVAMCGETLDPECVQETTDYIKGRDTALAQIDAEIARYTNEVMTTTDMSDPANSAAAKAQLNYLYSLRGMQNQSYVDIVNKNCSRNTSASMDNKNPENNYNIGDVIIKPPCPSGYEEVWDIGGIRCAKSSDQKCKDSYGANSVWTGKRNDQGVPECNCAAGYVWDTDGTICVKKSNEQVCKEMHGMNSIWTGKIGANGVPECDCESGYEWNADGAACNLLPEKSYDQICKETHGINSIWTGELYNLGQALCGCVSGYIFDVNSDQCVSESEIKLNIEKSSTITDSPMKEKKGLWKWLIGVFGFDN